MWNVPKPQNIISPDAALARLIEGNRRYVSGGTRRHDFSSERDTLVQGQNPFAVILSCADSRVAPEFAFDSGRGDLFVCRIAGNFANDDVVASIEYALAVLKAPLVMVLGHEGCGAVTATLNSIRDDVQLPGHLPSIARHLESAVTTTADLPGDHLSNAIARNVVHNVQRLRDSVPIISPLVESGSVRIVGALYRLSDGQIDLLP